ncbi:MAG: GNAT family N-acetyltransferase [Granulosicoccus sp.]
MSELKSKRTVCFPSRVFDRAFPAKLVQRDWTSDKRLLHDLQASWRAQYAEYLGQDEADSLVDRLLACGSLYAHDTRYTLQATIDDRCAGICSLRPMTDSGELGLITLLEVSENYRHRGVGRQLVRALETVSDSVMAHVSIHRPDVKKFYESLGFHCLERTHIDHYGHQLAFDVVARRCAA